MIVGRNWQNMVLICLLTLLGLFPGCENKAHARDTSTFLNQQRVLKFPQGISIGIVYLIPSNKLESRTNVAPAKGTIKIVVKPGQLLVFEAGTNVAKDPRLLTKTSLSGIDVLRLSFYAIEGEGAGLCDPILRFLPKFPNLQSLILVRSDSTDAGVSFVSNLLKLKEINISNSSVHGHCFRAFQALPLEKLDASLNRIESDTLQYLTKLPKLSNLRLRKAQLSKSAITPISKCTHLSVLDLSGNLEIDNSCISGLLSLRQLEKLNLSETPVTIEGLALLKSIKLKSLTLPQTVRSRTDLATLQRLFPNCELVSERSNKLNDDVRHMFGALH